MIRSLASYLGASLASQESFFLWHVVQAIPPFSTKSIYIHLRSASMTPSSADTSSSRKTINLFCEGKGKCSEELSKFSQF